jgi:L,D-peptidoglycan transpeptidase YkuD (ErfK/YbiS/YcfS/YnhG family)
MILHVSADGWLGAGGRRFRCVVGRSGIVTDKREGDGGTPAGRYPLREAWYRPDRVNRPQTGLPMRAIDKRDGWCDASGDPAYNCAVRLPYPASAENLWRDDHLYDLFVVIGYNDAPPVAGAGSAIFLHVAPLMGRPTAGCVALAMQDLLDVIGCLNPGDEIEIASPGHAVS